ncbi:Translin family-domain-containing protein [Podospora appendiculata]|uniref:Translin family-domain-containing protein n=1 Tax=Podospora appendiculata TaxID=314037 RepID=A0AAE0XCI5_9PEZI|nr:Translin family-domain-containing protein [Podospora appendiculata]
MSGFKRDRQGNAKKFDGPKPAPKPKSIVRNAYTPLFEHLRDELDEHHDRRDRIGKASRDITALSKKIIFSLQRARKIDDDLPQEIQADIDSRLAEIAKLLASIAPEVQNINRLRYARSLVCLEELVEALTFAHYVKTQTLIGHEELSLIVEDLARQGAASEDVAMPDAGEDVVQKPTEAADLPTVSITDDDYLYGVFDLTGEMMRFATTASALTGKMASGDAAALDDDAPRTIVEDMHDLGSFFEMLPLRAGNRVAWDKKLEVMRQSVHKVEKLGYDRVVRGSERPAGWVPDLSSADQSEGLE